MSQLAKQINEFLNELENPFSFLENPRRFELRMGENSLHFFEQFKCSHLKGILYYFIVFYMTLELQKILKSLFDQLGEFLVAGLFIGNSLSVI